VLVERSVVTLATGQYAEAEEAARKLIVFSTSLMAAESTLNVPAGRRASSSPPAR